MKTECSKAMMQESIDLFMRYARKGWNECQLYFPKYERVRACGYRWEITRSILVSTDGHEAKVAVDHSIDSRTNRKQRIMKNRILRQVAKAMKKEGYSGEIERRPYALLKGEEPFLDRAVFEKPLRSRQDVRSEYNRLSKLDLLGIIQRSAATPENR